MQRNTELLQQTMQHILDHPEQHKQDIVVNDCGTAGCFIGWAGMLSGMTAIQVDLAPLEYFEDLLGLTTSEAMRLFRAVNTRSMLELMVKDLINGDELLPWQAYRDQCGETQLVVLKEE